MTHPARIAEVARKHRLAKTQRFIARQETQIKELKAEAEKEFWKARAAERKAAEAFERAASELLNHKDKIDYVMKHMAHELVRAYGPKVAEEAQKLLAAGGQNRRHQIVPVFDAREVHDEVQVIELTGEIPAFRYHYQVALW